MPLPAALQARLKQRGILKSNTFLNSILLIILINNFKQIEEEEKEEVFAEDYDNESNETDSSVSKLDSK
jgi:hypothetical protein